MGKLKNNHIDAMGAPIIEQIVPPCQPKLGAPQRFMPKKLPKRVNIPPRRPKTNAGRTRLQRNLAPGKQR
ncbi:MAG: hypothetical protein CM15mP98_06510 [Paracoccaceae bacterium]|nr:MAG: hypothetical protein CM15mP98_06510 [Paracoccaceae bacterium]